MSEEPSQSGGARWVLYAWVVVPALLLGAVVVATLMQRPPKTPDDRRTVGGTETNDLAVVRSTLAKQNDLSACKAAVSRLNAHLRQPGAQPVPELPAGDLDRLRTDLGLSEAEAAELSSSSFTPLDAHHLETCFLLRDAAASLETTAPAGKGQVARMSPLERAEAGFRWVGRQVRLQKPEMDPAPVAFTLRRGWGGPMDRALAFLALVEQFGLAEDDAAGLQGCLLMVPGKDGPRLWACGVAVGAKPDALYLFDPRLGLPLPGPGGKGVATLAQAQADPKVLSQLDAAGVKYEVTAEDAKKAEIHLACPLSSAAPRMLLLQNVLLREREWKGKTLPPPVRVRIAETPAVARSTVQAAAKGAAVRFAPGGAQALVRALPKEEGGTDAAARVDLASLPGFTDGRRPMVVPVPRSQLLQLTAVPWTSFPARFRNPDEFGLTAGLGRDLRKLFEVQFLKGLNDPSSPREAILRGRLGQSTSEALVRERELWQRGRGVTDEEMTEGVERWIEEANRTYARALRGEGDAAAKDALANLYRWKVGSPMEVLMSTAIGRPKTRELTYQLGLCMFERGERAASMVALSSRSGQALPDEKRRAEEAFAAAANWLKELAAEGGVTYPAARRLEGEALWALGRKDEARSAWKDAPAALSDVEKLAGAWLGR